MPRTDELMKATRLFLMLLLTMLCAVSVTAQRASDLVIRSLNQAPSLPDGTIVVELDVLNEGQAASQPTRVRLFNAAGVELTSADVAALSPGARQPILLSIPPGVLPALSRQQVFVTVGLDVLPGGSALRGDIGAISVDVPAGDVAPPPPPVGAFGLENLIRQPQFALGQMLGIILTIGAVLLVLSFILNLLTPVERFPMWQPTYPPPPQIDPNTQEGRRYLWQAHAQNDAESIKGKPCQPNALIASKAVMGKKPRHAPGKLTNWEITGVRTGRYDAYGRIARTHHVMARRWVRHLHRAVKRKGLNPRQAERHARPAARTLARDIIRHADARTMMLPIALDVRLRSRSRDASVRFTLMGCHSGLWAVLDTWDSPPTRTADGHAVDQYTWALAGQQHGESLREMRRRLEVALTDILAGMLTKTPDRRLDKTGSPSSANQDDTPTEENLPTPPPASGS
jgi:hypothetical protein